MPRGGSGGHGYGNSVRQEEPPGRPGSAGRTGIGAVPRARRKSRWRGASAARRPRPRGALARRGGGQRRAPGVAGKPGGSAASRAPVKRCLRRPAPPASQRSRAAPRARSGLLPGRGGAGRAGARQRVNTRVISIKKLWRRDLGVGAGAALPLLLDAGPVLWWHRWQGLGCRWHLAHTAPSVASRSLHPGFKSHSNEENTETKRKSLVLSPFRGQSRSGARACAMAGLGPWFGRVSGSPRLIPAARASVR